MGNISRRFLPFFENFFLGDIPQKPQKKCVFPHLITHTLATTQFFFFLILIKCLYGCLLTTDKNKRNCAKRFRIIGIFARVVDPKIVIFFLHYIRIKPVLSCI